MRLLVEEVISRHAERFRQRLDGTQADALSPIRLEIRNGVAVHASDLGQTLL